MNDITKAPGQQPISPEEQDKMLLPIIRGIAAGRVRLIQEDLDEDTQLLLTAIPVLHQLAAKLNTEKAKDYLHKNPIVTFALARAAAALDVITYSGIISSIYAELHPEETGTLDSIVAENPQEIIDAQIDLLTDITKVIEGVWRPTITDSLKYLASLKDKTTATT